VTPDEFRAAGYAAIDWIAEYLESVEERPVASVVVPGALLAALPPAAPEDPEPWSAVLADLDRRIVPGLMHWQHPSFFGYFPANASPPAILGELLSAGLGVQGMLWVTSPACTELEIGVLEWLRVALGLPDRFSAAGPGGAVLQDTASSATLCALLAARDRCAAPLAQQVLYTSTQAHSSVAKAARIAGFAEAQLRLIPVDDTLAMRVDALSEQVAADRAAGRVCSAVCATVGTTSTGAVDPVAQIGRACGDAWLHVDAAWAGSAAICVEHRGLLAGLEHADSFVFNPHKWLLTNFDCSAFFVADRAPMLAALSILPEYLRNAPTASGEVVDFRDWQVPLGRRFRSLKLWFVLRTYGLSGLRAHIRGHIALAAWFAARIAADPRFELAAPVSLALVCFRHAGGDGVNQRLLDALNGSGRLFLTHTQVDGQLALRLAVGGRMTEARHVEAAWAEMVAWADREAVATG